MIEEQRSQVDVENLVKRELYQQGLYRLPVNPVQFANRLGIRVRGVVFKDNAFISMVETKGGKGDIFVAASEDAPYRMRVATAHSLGHYFLHLMEGNVIKDGKILDRPIDMFWGRKSTEGTISDEMTKELEANWFATELLMPTEFVQKEWTKTPVIPSLARTFGVTEEAIGQRVADLNVWLPAKKI